MASTAILPTGPRRSGDFQVFLTDVAAHEHSRRARRHRSDTRILMFISKSFHHSKTEHRDRDWPMVRRPGFSRWNAGPLEGGIPNKIRFMEWVHQSLTGGTKVAAWRESTAWESDAARASARWDGLAWEATSDGPAALR